MDGLTSDKKSKLSRSVNPCNQKYKLQLSLYLHMSEILQSEIFIQQPLTDIDKSV